ncbi:unnamed protein product [Caenorhabditis auriculariae]|uniref:Uncharacterized protein n=1 Tax=Caenorhabditis auriculariae TaxID=2777116 RepID=A0A8S1HL25_9PELO|nr:unnamed protein product [Caenorhabditis auriculariae]
MYCCSHTPFSVSEPRGSRLSIRAEYYDSHSPFTAPSESKGAENAVTLADYMPLNDYTLKQDNRLHVVAYTRRMIGRSVI